ncbi:unnamed protein product, partial [Prunus brigantina]
MKVGPITQTCFTDTYRDVVDPIPLLVNSGGRGKKASASPSQAVAAGIFQINTAVSTFRRLVDAIGTAKDTPDHRQKLCVS